MRRVGRDDVRICTKPAGPIRAEQQRGQQLRPEQLECAGRRRNSFTEGQAKSKIEGAGFTSVSALKKDDNGVWRGKASKGGSSTDVSVDFQGNVNTAK